MFDEILDIKEKEFGLQLEKFQLHHQHDIIENIVTMFNQNKGILSNDLGEISLFTLTVGKEKSVEVKVASQEDGNIWKDAVPCPALGGIVLASGTYQMSIIFPDGSLRRLTPSEPMANKRIASIRATEDGSAIALNINIKGYECIKLYPFVSSLNFEKSVIIKLFPHSKEECNDDLVNDFRFLGNETLVGGTSRGEVSLWNLLGEKITALKIFDHTKECARIDNMAISPDNKFITVLTSGGTMYLRQYYVHILKVQDNQLELVSKLEVRQGARGMWLSHCFQAADGSYVLVANNDHRDTRFYSFTAEGKDITWIH